MKIENMENNIITQIYNDQRMKIKKDYLSM